MPEIDIEEVFEEKNRLLNELVPLFAGIAEQHALQNKGNTDVITNAMIIATIEVSKKRGLTPLEILSEAFNSVFMVINQNVKFVGYEDYIAGLDFWGLKSYWYLIF